MGADKDVKAEDAGVDAGKLPRGENEQGPGATTLDASGDGTTDMSKASADGDSALDTDKNVVPVPEDAIDEDRDEADGYPGQYMEGEGRIEFYNDTKYPADGCVKCGFKHARGQFENCVECGADLTEHVGTVVDGTLVEA